MAGISDVDEYGFQRPNDFDYDLYQEFLSTYLVVMTKSSKKWQNIAKGVRQGRKSFGFKTDVRKGIPGSLRAEVWMFLSGGLRDQKAYGPNYYLNLLKQKHDPDLISIIQTDLPRTFPDNIYFHREGTYQKHLYNVLVAYGHHRPSLGYCQGMNYITGILLLVSKSEETSFWLLKALIERILPDYYSPDMKDLSVDLNVISKLVSLKYPDVSSHINQLGLPWEVIATKWLVCLYIDVLPIETVLRIWDCLFNEGNKILFRVALTIVEVNKEKLLACDSFTDVSQCFRSSNKDRQTLFCQEFIKDVYKVHGKLTNKKLNTMRINTRTNINSKSFK